MTTLLVTHPCFVLHDTGEGHPERPDRMRAIDKAMAHPAFQGLTRIDAPLRDDVEAVIALAHPAKYVAALKAARPAENTTKGSGEKTSVHDAGRATRAPSSS